MGLMHDLQPLFLLYEYSPHLSPKFKIIRYKYHQFIPNFGLLPANLTFTVPVPTHGSSSIMKHLPATQFPTHTLRITPRRIPEKAPFISSFFRLILDCIAFSYFSMDSIPILSYIHRYRYRYYGFVPKKSLRAIRYVLSLYRSSHQGLISYFFQTYVIRTLPSFIDSHFSFNLHLSLLIISPRFISLRCTK